MSDPVMMVATSNSYPSSLPRIDDAGELTNGDLKASSDRAATPGLPANVNQGIENVFGPNIPILAPPRPEGEANGNTDSSRSRSSSPRYQVPETEWHLYRSMSFKLLDLPEDVTTREIWDSIKTHVEDIIFIDVLEDRHGDRNGIARIKIEPPLARNPWKPRCYLLREDGTRVQVRFQTDQFFPHDGSTMTPLQNTIPASLSVPMSRLCFGTMVTDSSIMVMHSLQPPPSSDFRLDVDFRQKRVRLQFVVDLKSIEKPQRAAYNFKAIVKFAHIKEFWRLDRTEGGCTLVVPLPIPPTVFRKTHDTKSTHSIDKSIWNDRDQWFRQTNIIDSPERLASSPLSLNQDLGEVIDLGRWTTYCLNLDEAAKETCLVMERALRDYNIDTKVNPKIGIIAKGEAKLWGMLDAPSNVTSSSSAALTLLETPSSHLAFTVRYQLEVCICRGILNEYNLSPSFVSKLASQDPDAASRMLEYFADRGHLVSDPMSMFNDIQARAYFPHTILPHYCAVIRKVIVTPTALYLSTPVVETTNRVLRKFSNINDRFMRVQFTDELNESRLRPSDDRADYELFIRVFRTLKNGIRIGDRRYEFLAFGNSQFRENGAYFFCPDDHLSCDDVRAWMGDLTHIKTVAKYAARLGQCFSTTREIKGISVPSIKTIPDIEKNGFNFTDGVGKIPKFLAEMIAEELKLGYVPSAFQFRMGGCKGMLVVWQDVGAFEVHIRKSQSKFTSVYNGLEIIKCSQFSAATLNRLTITVLSSLGVPDEAFENLLNEQLANYDKAMLDKHMAVDLLHKYIDENQTSLTMASMIANGFMDSQEPFMWSLLRLWKSWSMKALKEKTRIIVEDGAFVLGCVDETGILQGQMQELRKTGSGRGDGKQDGLPQIFLQIPCPSDPGHYVVVRGKCLVGRNPSLHPGDIRVVQAVDVPELRHLKDVVVFPQTGYRDIPSMCSGGDLDGDDFFVIWNEDLLPRETDYPPMDYTGPRAQETDNITIESLQQFFVLYMQNDSLAQIAHAHLAWADSLPEHAKDQTCKCSIAQAFSVKQD